MRFFTALAAAAVALVAGAQEYSTQHSDPIATDLAPLLSSNARIYVRGGNSTLFDEVTRRYALVKPDISAAISVGAAEDVAVIVGDSLMPPPPLSTSDIADPLDR
jgi:hypothetical protein